MVWHSCSLGEHCAGMVWHSCSLGEHFTGMVWHSYSPGALFADTGLHLHIKRKRMLRYASFLYA